MIVLRRLEWFLLLCVCLVENRWLNLLQIAEVEVGQVQN